jgi:OmpA-OmpF porin, OOP family
MRHSPEEGQQMFSMIGTSGIVCAALFAFSSNAATLVPPSIPHKAGLTVTTALTEDNGDYESRKRVVRHEGDAWLIAYSAGVPETKTRTRVINSERFVYDADLVNARSYRAAFEENVQEDYPGTTALGVSSLVLAELHKTGKSRYALVGESRWVLPALAAQSSAKLPGSDLISGLARNNNVSFKGELQKKTRGEFSVLINGQMQKMPVLIATGRFTASNGQAMEAELILLDDAANPLALQWRIGKSALRVVRVDFPIPKASAALTEQLRAQKRVVLPGLYFDFAAATLRPESSAILPAIIAAIRSVPTGVLKIEGHTDAIGVDSSNLALSKARAESVRLALIKLDKSLSSRLSSQGLGETKPQADNNTLEGRARNRRVELVLP